MAGLGDLLQAFGEGYTGRPSYNTLKKRQTLEDLRFQLEQQKFNREQESEQKTTLIKEYAVNPDKAVAEWSRLSGKPYQRDPNDNSVVDPSTGDRFRVNVEKGLIE